MQTAQQRDALAEALGRVVAEFKSEFRKDLDRMEAENRAIRAENKALQSELRGIYDQECRRIADAIANVKDGAAGAPGKDGRDGVDGKDGTAGSDGRDGVDGKDGAIGPPGANGRDGVDGKDGEAGAVGQDGIAGVDGKDGAVGPAGADGKDVDPAVVAALTATVKAIPAVPSSFMIDEAGSLQAIYPDGTFKAIGRVRGEDGERGASIMDGEINDEGHLVLRMSDGRKIPAGLVRGDDGEPGGDGKAGANGRDAIELRILPGIDESKSYAEGICARFRGGVIRAERATDPISDGDIAKAGWGVVLEGIAEEVEAPLDDGRVIERVTFYTSGKFFKRSIQTTTPIYRGIWKDGNFQRGDMTTRDGSLWHCERETTATPGTSPDWKLCAKRGQNGKDGKPGDPGKPGAEGRPGRDLTQMNFDGGKH